jgi:probable rRNA maturation factor
VRRIEIDAPARERAAARVARRALRSFLIRLRLDDVAVSVVLCSDAAIRKLNAKHRGVDSPTDVLSFPSAPTPGEARLLGDLVVSLPTARRRARELRVPFEAELRRYLAHGLLHLLGHDHARPAQAKRMAALERRLLGDQGLVARAKGGRRSTASRARRPRGRPA